jgi:DNA-binding transcriptional ArsR family regulator
MARKLSTDRPLKTTALSLADARAWRALRKPFRWRLFEAVRAIGGISAQDLARRVGITPQLMLYHLQLLEGAGLVVHEVGKRYRGKGGKFRACGERIELSLRTSNARELRRATSILSELDTEAREPDPSSLADATPVRWERLTAAEVRQIQDSLDAVERILAKAASRRAGDGTLPDATHAVSIAIRPAAPSTMPSPAWSSRRSRRGR